MKKTKNHKKGMATIVRHDRFELEEQKINDNIFINQYLKG